MGDNLFQVIITTIKAKITPIVTKIKLWTSWNFIRTRLISKIRDFFASLFNIKPKHKKDYYTIGNWLISRKLVISILVVIGVVSVIYLVSVGKTLSGARTEGMKTYEYNSVLLRFASEKVRITGKSGYVAYEGDVADGSVTGYGTLYRPDGSVVYQGNFVKNMYEGNGILYYPSGVMNYKGYFQANKYQGTGSLYRENGTLIYEGDFVAGQKDGTGKLYDNGSNQVFAGSFSKDELVYSTFLGKPLSEVAQMYTGQRLLYEEEDGFVVVMEDIDAMYVSDEESELLDDSMTVNKLYVFQDCFKIGAQKCETITQVKTQMGIPIYEGYSDIILPEAVAIDYLAQSTTSYPIKSKLDVSSEYDDYFIVEGYDENGVVYLYSFYGDGLIYTFVCEDKGDTFLFYSIEKEGEAAK